MARTFWLTLVILYSKTPEAAYIQNLTDNGSNYTNPNAMQAIRALYKVNITTPGTYQLFLRWRAIMTVIPVHNRRL